MIRAGNTLFSFLFCAELCLTLAACGSAKKEAAIELSNTYSCPIEKIEITEITKVTAKELWLRANPEPEIPAEIRNAPDRIATWRKNYNKSLECVMRGLNRMTLFHAKGCGHTENYACACINQKRATTAQTMDPQGRCTCLEPPSAILPTDL